MCSTWPFAPLSRSAPCVISLEVPLLIVLEELRPYLFQPVDPNVVLIQPLSRVVSWADETEGHFRRNLDQNTRVDLMRPAGKRGCKR